MNEECRGKPGPACGCVSTPSVPKRCSQNLRTITFSSESRCKPAACVWVYVDLLSVYCNQDYLPPKVHEAFLSTLTEFVLLPWREAMRASMEGASQGGSQVQILSPS